VPASETHAFFTVKFMPNAMFLVESRMQVFEKWDGETHKIEPSRVKVDHPAWSRNSAIPQKEFPIRSHHPDGFSSFQGFPFAQRLAVARPSVKRLFSFRLVKQCH
jgi:hypothetical protein